MPEKPNLKYFTREEFRGWYSDMSRSLLIKLDALRERHGLPIHISDTPGAVGRHAGQALTRHNIDRWGLVYAVDVFPEGIGYDKLKALEFYYIAKDLGFKGIGLYPYFKPSMGFHLDVRGAQDSFIDWVDTAIYPDHRYIDYFVEAFCLTPEDL